MNNEKLTMNNVCGKPLPGLSFEFMNLPDPLV
jgi:hypothetical protein